MNFPGRKSFESVRPMFSALASISLLIGSGVGLADSASALTVTRVLVDVDFTSASISGSTITNTAADKTADLTVNGSPTGIGTASGLTFPNTVGGSTTNYLTGNLGNTSVMSEIVIEFDARFPDTGCAAQMFGSMVFGLGTASTFIPYNIYRTSNLIGFNTFSSDLYGIAIPDTTEFHSYKFVMVPNPAARSAQQIWVDGVQQSLSAHAPSPAVAPCGTLSAPENASNRVFTGGASSYTDGSFMLMSHPLLATNWGTTGTLKNLKITTSNTYVEPSAPSIGTVTAGDGQLSVEFTEPTSNGGSSITDYEYSTDNGVTWVSASSTTSPIVITGLTNGTTYNVKIRAVNVAGDGEPSAAVAASPAGAGGGATAPLIDEVVEGDGQLSIFFAPPSDDGGSPITDYEYSTDSGVNWVSTGTTSSPIVITGLPNDVEVSVQLRAVTENGPGEASTAVVGTPSPDSDSTDKLADTGVDAVSMAAVAGTVLALGALLFVLSRRRQRV